MFLFARHSAGLLNKNFVKQRLHKILESQLHGSRRKSYLSAPFSFIYAVSDLREDAYVCPINTVNRTTESAIYVMELTVMG